MPGHGWEFGNRACGIFQEPLTSLYSSFHKVCFYESLSYLNYKWGLQTVGVIRFTLKRGSRPLLSGSTASKSRKGTQPWSSVGDLRSLSSPVLFQPGSRRLRAALPFARPTSERSAPEGGEPANPRGLWALADRARPHPRPAPSRWQQNASRLRPGGEAPGVAEGSGSRERRSLTYFPRRPAHA